MHHQHFISYIQRSYHMTIMTHDPQIDYDSRQRPWHPMAWPQASSSLTPRAPRLPSLLRLQSSLCDVSGSSTDLRAVTDLKFLAAVEGNYSQRRWWKLATHTHINIYIIIYIYIIYKYHIILLYIDLGTLHSLAHAHIAHIVYSHVCKHD